MAELVGGIYADALFEISLSNQSQDEIKAELNGLAEILQQNQDYVKMLASPIVSVEEKHALAESTFGGRICDNLMNLIFLLIDNDRFGHFIEISDDFNKLYDKHKNILRITAVTASPLSPELNEKLANKLSELSKKDVVISNEIDKSLIGGILLKYDNMQVDATVQSKLEGMKKQVFEKML